MHPSFRRNPWILVLLAAPLALANTNGCSPLAESHGFTGGAGGMGGHEVASTGGGSTVSFHAG